MSLKLIKSLLLFCILIFCHAATAQEGGNASNIKKELASVNTKIEAASKENSDLKARMSEIQNEIDELKRLSEQKEEELNSLRQKGKSSN